MSQIKFLLSISNTTKEWQNSIRKKFESLWIDLIDDHGELFDRSGEKYLFFSETGCSYRVWLSQQSPRKLTLFFEINTNVAGYHFLFEEYVIDSSEIEQFFN